ncbi:MAG: hypothetical protein JXB85_04735 [Anaerolineales bacterium]|nr:hypothetical protein [Anaerolineales bacterium]
MKLLDSSRSDPEELQEVAQPSRPKETPQERPAPHRVVHGPRVVKPEAGREQKRRPLKPLFFRREESQKRGPEQDQGKTTRTGPVRSAGQGSGARFERRSPPAPGRPTVSQTGPHPAPAQETGPRSAQPTSRSINPGLRLRAIESATHNGRRMQLPLLNRIMRRPESEKTLRAYWSITGTISLIVNIILIAALIILARYTFMLKDMVVNGILYEGLYQNFGAMDAASIVTTLPISTTVHASIPVTINQATDVVLTQNTTINGARVTVSTGGLNINNAPANIVLPAGTILPVQLNLVVPVEADIPVSMDVTVNIPLNQTELHAPFVGLQDAVEPYVATFYNGEVNLDDKPFCRVFRSLCEWWYFIP